LLPTLPSASRRQSPEKALRSILMDAVTEVAEETAHAERADELEERHPQISQEAVSQASRRCPLWPFCRSQPYDPDSGRHVRRRVAKQMITLATDVLGVTVTFMSNLVPNPSTVTTVLMALVWLTLLGLSVVAGTFRLLAWAGEIHTQRGRVVPCLRAFVDRWSFTRPWLRREGACLLGHVIPDRTASPYSSSGTALE
jgi:hypothetical protein